MKAIYLSLIIASLLSITACDDAKKITEAKIKNPLEGHMKALKAAKDLEHKLIESEKKRRETIDALATPEQ